MSVLGQGVKHLGELPLGDLTLSELIAHSGDHPIDDHLGSFAQCFLFLVVGLVRVINVIVIIIRFLLFVY
jgi:hypothetical protein